MSRASASSAQNMPFQPSRAECACRWCLQSQSKERVVCLTAERRSKRRGFKGSLHICKYSAGKTQASMRSGVCPVQ